MRKPIPGILLTAIALAVAAVMATGVAETAASPVCRSLEAELAALPRGGGRGQFARYDRAVDAQQQQLQKARGQARRHGCGFAIFGSRVEQCGALAATIEKMERNLLELQRKRNGLAGGADPRRERARLLAALEVNGCRKREKEMARETPRAIDGRSGATVAPEPGTVKTVQRGAFRTLCVRTCDGYFFPVSYASPQEAFQRDEMKCRAMCPGTEVELFYHRFPEQESTEMMSVATGEHYRDAPFAYRYRRTDHARPASCGCAPAKNFTIIGGNRPRPEAGRQPEIEVALPRPLPRPDPALDPESAANLEGGLDAAAIERLIPRPEREKREQNGRETAAAADPEQRRVRVVGPVFLPDPEEAIDLRAPARPDGR